VRGANPKITISRSIESIVTIQKNTPEWWQEVNHLAELLKKWAANHNDEELSKLVHESMERLGYIMPH